MRAARFSDPCVDAKADAALAMLDGGSVRLYDGPKPDRADDAPAPAATCLATLVLSTPAFSPARGGRASAYAFRPCLADAQGTPTWFRASTAAGAAMFDGTVGPPPSGPNGEEYDMCVDGDLFEGGEVVVESFDYVELKQER